MPHWNHLGRESLVRPCLAPGLVPKFLPGAAWCRSSDSCLFLYLWTQRFVTSTLVPKLFPDLKMIANFSILMNNNTFYDICHKIPPVRWITLDNIHIRCWSNWLIQVYIPHHKCDVRSEVLLVLVNHHHIMNAAEDKLWIWNHHIISIIMMICSPISTAIKGSSYFWILYWRLGESFQFNQFLIIIITIH